MANDRLSRACTLLLEAERSLEYGADDIRAFGAPAECMDLVIEGVDRALLAGIKRLGYLHPDQVVELARKRTSDRWVHFNLGH